MSTKKFLRFTVLLVLTLGVPASAFAGWWEVTNLHPTGQTSSHAYGVSGGQQFGDTTIGTARRAALWSGTAASWVDLNPADAILSWGQAAGGGQQVGYVRYSGIFRYHAGLWNGTAASFVDLSPSGYTHSMAFGVSNGQQVGYATASNEHAGMWSGTAASFVDLHPAGYVSSRAQGIADGQQVGYANISSTERHAALWSGTANSFVDLHPAGSTGTSTALGTSNGQQVGWAYFGDNPHAGIWSGTAASWVDLNPKGALNSYARSMSHGRQVGNAFITSQNHWHAGMWNGTSESWFDLHALLGPGYTYSTAQSIEVVDRDIWITGWTTNPVTGNEEAILWHYVVPEPSSLLALGGGLLALGGLIRRRR